MRLIDADALKTYEQLEPMGNGNYKSVLIVYKNDIENAPTIEPVKTGKWINDNGQTKCSICGNPIPIRKVVLRGEVMWEDNSPVNYCMNCGAKMENNDE